jgi:ubiquinol-cytochrome c reductase iron-sulfur subunit
MERKDGWKRNPRHRSDYWGLGKTLESIRMKANCLAPPTGIFQQRTFSTTPSRPVEAPSRVGGVPDWSAYQSSGKGENTRTLSYFMVGSLGVLAASGAKSTVSDILSNMAASADVLALAKIEVEMGSIPEGTSSILEAGIWQLTI